jgi:hypothetical protein
VIGLCFADEVLESNLPLRLPQTDAAPSVSVVACTERVFSGPEALDRYVFRGFMDGAWWVLGQDEGERSWRFAAGRACWGLISEDLSTVSVTSIEGAPERWVVEVVQNWVLSFRLALAGRWCFHGSAVVNAQREVVAFLGPSGAGKTTAALACLVMGAEVIADDLVVGSVSSDEVMVGRTSTILKVRPQAEGLVRAVASQPTGLEDRLDVDISGHTQSAALARIVFLQPGRPGGELTGIPAAQASHMLMENSKLVAWADPEYLAREFDAACEIADRVPAYSASLPDVTERLSVEARTMLERILDRRPPE